MPQPETLAALPDDIRKRISGLFDGMMRALYKEKGATFRIDIMTDPAVRDFVGAHASTLDESFSRVEMSDRMRRRLSRSNYVFSGLKTFHELNEAFPSMLDENGKRKSFERFLNDVRKIDSTYNANYLRAEYNFVNASARAAAKWESFAEDGDRYNLQYRTQSDDKVRPEHAALNRVTLPPSDPFWEEFYPPNGWNCFVGHTPVLTPGGWKFIKDIRQGDLIVGGSGEYRTVIGTHSRSINTELVRIHTKRTLTTCTKNHRFLTRCGWIAANDLKPFDILIQVGKISTLGKLINAIHNSGALLKYMLVSFKGNRKPVTPKAINGNTEGWNKKINQIPLNDYSSFKCQSNPVEMTLDNSLGNTFRISFGTHVLRMHSTRTEGVVNRLSNTLRAIKRRSNFKSFCNSSNKGTICFILSLSDMLSGLCQRMVNFSEITGGIGATHRIIPPLNPDSLRTMPNRDPKMHKNPSDRTPIDTPMDRKPSKTPFFDKISHFYGIKHPASFNGFDSIYDFLRQTFFHTRYSLVRRKDTTKRTIVDVYNLSVSKDESYVIPAGIVHNCRCTVVQVLKSRYPATPHDEAMGLGEIALQRDTKGIFRFNPGKQEKAIPDYNPYTIRRCRDCDLAQGNSGKLVASIPDSELCQACHLVRVCERNRSETITHGKGIIEISHLVNRTDSDFERLLSVARHFAAGGARVVLTPKMTRPATFEYDCIYGSLRGTRYDGKCPDLKIDNYWYEHEGFSSNNPKNAFRNMLNHGLKQSNRIIIDRPNLTDAYMKHVINQRIKDGQHIAELWLHENGQLRLLYKKSEE